MLFRSRPASTRHTNDERVTGHSPGLAVRQVQRARLCVRSLCSEVVNGVRIDTEAFCGNSSVESAQTATLVGCEGDQVTVGDLPGSQSARQWKDGEQRDRIGPEVVTGH